MAIIVVKGRREPIELENDRALKIKARWLGLDDTPKADPNDVVDLGVWAGEYGRIVEIEMTKAVNGDKPEDPMAKQEAEQRRLDEEWRKMTPDQKSKATGKFKLKYLIMAKAQPEPAVVAKAEALLLAFYKKAKPEVHAPDEIWYPLLPKPYILPPPKPLICSVCKVKEAKRNSLYCSGKCELDAKNGQISTA